MKTYNTTPNVSDLARWIDLQLSTIIEGVSAGYTLGNYDSVWIDKGATVFNVSLANGETVEIDSDNYNTAEEIATAIISTLNNTPATMNTTETKTMYTDYKTAVHWCHNALIMCNNIPQIDPTVIDNARFAWYDEETETEAEVFQWFITDCTQWDVEYLEEHFPGLLFTYSDLLDCFILCVDHFGTAWEGVRIETTLPNAAKENI